MIYSQYTRNKTLANVSIGNQKAQKDNEPHLHLLLLLGNHDVSLPKPIRMMVRILEIMARKLEVLLQEIIGIKNIEKSSKGYGLKLRRKEKVVLNGEELMIQNLLKNHPPKIQ